MGLTSKSKFTFPLPGRRQKQAQPSPPPPPPPGVPLSKAQKVLGTSHISVDSPSTLSPSSKWGWDSRSNSGISIAVSETAASHNDDGEMGLGIVHEGEIANHSPRRELRWEDESEIIPKTFTRQSNMAMGDTTDASSLRRRQSSSTIASFYDKSKLPLSISQQTSNSAMAKGVPAKVHAMLDMDGTNAGYKDKKKKPSRLDLSSLLPKSMSQRHLRPDVDRSHVLGPDMMTKSPSAMSMSPDMTPPPTSSKPRTDRFLRRKKTKESLKDVQPPPESRQQYPQIGRPATSPNPNSHRPTKSTVQLYSLYDHYEQRMFAEAMEQDRRGGSDSPLEGHTENSLRTDFVPSLQSNPVARVQSSNSAKQQQSPDMCLKVALSPLSLTSVPADSASISSRHTRTSKASKRTDRSLTDLDLRQNSVLSLSSDSEDDGYEPSYNSSLAVPPLSDGQASPTSPRSAMSQRSGASSLQDPGRPKPQKRTSFASSPQFLPIPEGSSPSNPPRINTRLSSLNPNSNSAPKQAPNSPKPDPRMSIASTSTSKTLMFGVAAGDHPQGPKIISMMRRNSPPYQPTWPPSSDGSGLEKFPTPPGYRAHRPSLASVTSDHPTPPLSPTSVDFYLQSHHTSLAALDDESIRSGKSFGSGTKAGGPRRGSGTGSLHDAGSGRFMAVTKQEEMLLAALRIKRARMREDIIAEFEEDTDRDEHSLDRHITNDSSASSSRISRQSSASTMRTYETGTLTMRPQHHQQPQIRISTGSTEKKTEANCRQGGSNAPLTLDDATENAESKFLEPIPDLADFIDFDNFDTESLALPMQRHSIRVETAEREKSLGNSRSRSSSNSGSRAPSSLGTRTSSSSLSGSTQQTRIQKEKDSMSPRTVLTHRGIRNDIPSQILEEESLDDEDEDVPRPDSPISPTSFPMPMALTRKKQVRLSAVGNHQVNVEAGWWNDSG